VQEIDEQPAVVVVAVDRRITNAPRDHVEDAVGQEVAGKARHASNVEAATR
jgi:hypothetical protein